MLRMKSSSQMLTSFITAALLLFSAGIFAADGAETAGARRTGTAEFEAGFNQRSAEIAAALTGPSKSTEAFDSLYEFSKLAIDGMLPPVLKSLGRPISSSNACGGNQTLTVVARAQPYCKPQADGSQCKPFGWRDIALEDLPRGPALAVSADLKGSEFRSGQREADLLLSRNMSRLSDTYLGMLAFRNMQACGLVFEHKN